MASVLQFQLHHTRAAIGRGDTSQLTFATAHPVASVNSSASHSAWQTLAGRHQASCRAASASTALLNSERIIADSTSASRAGACDFIARGISIAITDHLITATKARLVS